MSRVEDPPARRVTPQDIKDKLAELEGEVTDTVESTKTQLMAIGAVVAVGIIVVAFTLGKRRGRRKSTVIEIRRS